MSDIGPGQVGAPDTTTVAAGSATNALGIAAGSTDETAAQLYGYLATFLTMPVVGDILRQAALEGWDQSKLEAKLATTEWWKTTQESARQFDAKWQTDRASIEAQIAQQVASLRAELTQQGVPIDDSRLHEIAKQAIRMNWSPEQTKAAMDSELMRSPDVLHSKVGTDLKALAGQYAVELSDPAIATWAAHIISGIKGDEQYREYMVSQAKSRFGDKQLGQFLDQGGTVSQFYDPYRQRAAAVLGVNPDSVDLSDPKWFAALNARDPKDPNTVRAMTVNEWDQYMKATPTYEYDKTPQAKQDAYALAGTIGTMFGRAS